MNNKYCHSLVEYKKRKTNDVTIGDVPMGSNYPIRIQSMTTTNTMDTDATVKQSIKIIKAGSDYVRITAPSKNEANNLKNIKKELKEKGFNTPLIADIHFTPNAAEIAARIVEKVRINPGNYVDTKKFQLIEYTNSEYANEIEKIRKKFIPLIQVCKEYGTAMRIGTNHGSLSDRILSKYGDTPLGMVESALEFLRICKDEKFNNIVLSMKSSNPIVMVQAYRLLVNRMDHEEMHYPLHLGVTEAGEGEAGRIKSSLGIGTLLEDGLGDTIRVSLTEAPEFEIPVAKKILDKYINKSEEEIIEKIKYNPINPFDFKPRVSHEVLNIGGNNVPRVINYLNVLDSEFQDIISELGYIYKKENDKWHIGDLACDYIYIDDKELNYKLPGTLGIIQKYSKWKINKQVNYYPLLNVDEYSKDTILHKHLNFICIKYSDLTDEFILKIKNDLTVVLIIYISGGRGFSKQRRMFIKLMNLECNIPVILYNKYNNLTLSDLQIYSSSDLGGLFVDGLGDGIFLSSEKCSLESINRTSFGILQASRARITKTEYISCPSCGRTLFDLQEVTSRIRSKTQHLKGIKIGIMGCIVNGPGEMADADYGYVGTGIEKISLYKKQEVIKKDVPMNIADTELIKLIKDNGDWIDP